MDKNEAKSFAEHRRELSVLLDEYKAAATRLLAKGEFADAAKMAQSIKHLQGSIRSLLDDRVEEQLAELEAAIAAFERDRSEEEALAEYQEFMQVH